MSDCRRSDCMCGNQRPERPSCDNRQRNDCGCRTAIEKECGCRNDDVLNSLPIAMAYVPWQHWKKTYELDKALCVGTIFPELDKPFVGCKGGVRR